MLSLQLTTLDSYTVTTWFLVKPTDNSTTILKINDGCKVISLNIEPGGTLSIDRNE